MPYTMKHLIIALLLPAWILSSATSAHAGITDADAVVTENSMPLPATGEKYIDPGFGTPVMRIGKNFRREYSQLQAWNSDMSLILVDTTTIIDADTYAVVHQIDWGWPDWGVAVRWSPADPYVLYYLDDNNSFCQSGAAFMRYRLVPGTSWTGQRELVRCFSEYVKFGKNESYEELSDDGRYVALVGERSDGRLEIFAYDILNDVKGNVLVVPQTTYNGQTMNMGLDWAGMSPSGKYVVVHWSGGWDRYYGVEAFDLDMNYVGKIHRGGHGDMTMDQNGVEWYVVTNAANGSYLSDRHYIIKARIPDGSTVLETSYNGQTVYSGSINAAAALIDLNWYFGVHVSCRNTKAPGFCVIGTYSANNVYDNEPFYDEIFKVYLDSTPSSPHIERLAHHRSSPYAIASRDGCSGTSDYWAQPHATVSPNGTRILFGSNWRTICSSNEINGFIIFATKDGIAPGKPENLKVK